MTKNHELGLCTFTTIYLILYAKQHLYMYGYFDISAIQCDMSLPPIRYNLILSCMSAVTMITLSYKTSYCLP